MNLYDKKKDALELLKLMKQAFKELKINVKYNKTDSLEVLNAVIDSNFKKLGKFYEMKTGQPFRKGGIQWVN